jgi:hypothetical protein
MSKQRVWLWVKPNSPFSGANLNNYCYETELDGWPWLADIDEDQMFEPATFEVDPDPCGQGFKDTDDMMDWLRSRSYFKEPAREVGYIEDGKLYITKLIKVETGWAGTPMLVATDHDYIRPNAKAEL